MAEKAFVLEMDGHRIAVSNPDKPLFPGRLTAEQRKNKLRDRLYLDIQCNAFSQTPEAPYSLRAHGRRWPRPWIGRSWTIANSIPAATDSTTCSFAPAGSLPRG